MVLVVSDGPRIEHRDAVPSLGISLVTPFRGMLGVRDRLLAELETWLAERALHTSGPFFLRLHRVHMAADLEIEVGVFGVDLAAG